MNEYNNNENGQYTQPDPSAHYGAAYGQPQGSYTPPQEPPQPKKPKKGMGAGAVIAVCLVFSLLAALLGSGATYLLMRDKDEVQPPEATATPAPELTTNTVLEGAVDETASHIYNDLACKQVVGITTDVSYTNIFGQVSSSSVTGSGFVIDADGYIMTNYHVIETAVTGGYDVSVLTYDETEYDAEIVGYDKANDVAVLKIDAEGLAAAELASSDELSVGQVVYAVGNPLGELNYTMTRGIVSATDRDITTEETSVPINMFQIDAAVNSGNSGGPVYNAAGQVVGMVTAKTSATGVEGLGFAIPISDAAHVANQILEYGYVKDRATLGVTAETVPQSVAERYNLVEGAYVRGVVEDGPADAAGIREDDIITAVDGKDVTGSTELTAIIRSYSVGDTVELTLWRGGETVTVSVTLGESQPPSEEETEAQQQPQQGQYPGDYGDMEDFFRQFFGGFGF